MRLARVTATVFSALAIGAQDKEPAQDADTTVIEGNSSPPSPPHIKDPDLASVMSATQHWPLGVTPYMAPTALPLAAKCRITLPNWHKLSWAMYAAPNSSSRAVKRRSEQLPQALGSMNIALVNGTLIDQNGRIGSIVFNHQFQFDGPPQAGSIFTAGWSLCDSAVGSVLALGGQFSFFVCGYANNIYNIVVDNTCGHVYLQLAERSGSLDLALFRNQSSKISTDFVSADLAGTEVSGATADLSTPSTPGFKKEKRTASLTQRGDQDIFVGDAPYPLNYILTTQTWIETAQTVTEDAYEGQPATTYTLPGGTFVATLHPVTFSAPTAAPEVKRDGIPWVVNGTTTTSTQYVSQMVFYITETPSDLSPVANASISASLTAPLANLAGFTVAMTSTSTFTYHSTRTTTASLSTPTEPKSEDEVKVSLSPEAGARVDLCGFLCGWLISLLIWGVCYLVYGSE